MLCRRRSFGRRVIRQLLGFLGYEGVDLVVGNGKIDSQGNRNGSFPGILTDQKGNPEFCLDVDGLWTMSKCLEDPCEGHSGRYRFGCRSFGDDANEVPVRQFEYGIIVEGKG